MLDMTHIVWDLNNYRFISKIRKIVWIVQQSVSPQCSPQTARKQCLQHKLQIQCSTIPLIPAPPIPPRRQSPTTTPHHSPGISPKHNQLIESNNKIKFTKILTPIKVSKSCDKKVAKSESNSELETKVKQVTAPTLSPPTLLFGTWPGAATNAVANIQQSGVTQSASTSPTNVFVTSPLILRHTSLETHKSSSVETTGNTSNLCINSNTFSSNVNQLNDSIEEHSYANTHLNRMFPLFFYYFTIIFL